MEIDSTTEHDIPMTLPTPLAPRAHNYSRGPPSPPRYTIPHVGLEKERVLPEYVGIGGEQLSDEDLKIITQVRHVAVERTTDWKYPDRRTAQLILPFLYLGPSTAAKDRDFIRKEGITLLLAIRDTKSAQASLLSADRVAKELGIASGAIDVAGNQELIAAFPQTVKTINDHLLAIFHHQTSHNADGDAIIDPQTFRRGKVLVYCESGNDRSACAVTAYLIAMFGFDIVGAIQFVQSQRFCVGLDDAYVQLLAAFYDIVQARRMVSISCYQKENNDMSLTYSNRQFPNKKTGKRMLEETEDEDDKTRPLDIDRFASRQENQPFLETPMQNFR